MAANIRIVVTCLCCAFALSPLQATAQANGGGDTPSGQNAKDDAKSNNGTSDSKALPSKIRVKVLLEDPFVMVQPGGGYHGMFIDVLQHLTAEANLSYDISLQGDQQYGHEYSPGNWSGLLGTIQRGEADLAVAPISIMSKRQDIVDFTQPIMSAGLRILYKTPDSHTDGEAFAILLSPFTPGLWLLLLLIFLGISLLFYVIGRFSPYEDHAFVGKAATYEGLTLLNSFLYTFSSMTFQGYTAAPRSISGRLLAAFWWVFVLLVIAAYSASLCAVFISFKPSIYSLPFATFDELSRQSSVAYGVVKGGTTQTYLNNSKRPVQRRLWSTISAHGDNLLVNTVSEGVYRVQHSKGDFAFIMEGPMAEYMSQRPPCELMTVGEELGDNAYAFACSKTLPQLCSKLNTAILQMQEEDFIYDLKQKWMSQGCSRDDPGEYIFQGLAFFDTFGKDPQYMANRAVTLRRFSTGFLLLFLGIVLSGAILLGEMFYAKKRGTAVPQRMPRGMEDQERIDREYRDEDA